MPNMLALVACVEPHEGAWLRPQGREAGVKVYPELGPGEELELQVEGDPIHDKISFTLQGGYTPLPLATVVRFRVVKSGRGTPTNVEVVRVKPSKSRNANDS